MPEKRKKKKASKTNLRPKAKARDGVDKMKVNGKLQTTELAANSSAAKKALSDTTGADANAAPPPGMKAVRYAVFPKGVGVVYVRPGEKVKERIMQIDFTKTPPKGQTELNDSLRAVMEKNEPSLGGVGDPPKVIAVAANKNDEDAVTAQLQQMVDDMNEEARGDNNKPQYAIRLLSSSLGPSAGLFGKRQVKLRYELTPAGAVGTPAVNAPTPGAESREGPGKNNIAADEPAALAEAFKQRGAVKKMPPGIPKFDAIQALARKNEYGKILESFGSNWFTAKEHLAYITYAKDPAEYAQRMEIMKKLLEFRKQETMAALKPVMLAVAQDVLGGKAVPESSFEEKPGDTGYRIVIDGKVIVDANAPGSQSLTSDIDISFGVPGREEFEVDLVQQFNHAFRKKWPGLEAGVVFDVNAYSSGFMAKAADLEGYKTSLGEEKKKQVEEGQKHTQLALGMLPIRQHFDGKPDPAAAWEEFKTNSLTSISDLLKSKGLDGAKVTSALDDLSRIFGETEKLQLETAAEKTSIQQAVKDTRAENLARGANQPPLSEKHLDAVTGDMLYEAQLHKIRDLLDKRNNLLRKIEQLSIKGPGAELKKYQDELATNLLETEREQGKALVYANEAYYTAGAAIHVVKGMQSGGAVQLSSQQQMASLLMNIGYKLVHYEHNKHEGGEGRALVATSKYGERIRDVIKQGTPDYIKEREAETGKPGAGGLYNKEFDPKLHELFAGDLGLLDREKELIVKYKKTKSLESPAAREAKALADLGQEMNAKRQEDAYLGIAMKVLGPYYAAGR